MMSTSNRTKKVALIESKFKETQEVLGDKRLEAILQLFFLFSIGIGFFLNLTASIIYEQIKTSKYYSIFTLIILLITLLGLIWIFDKIDKIFVKPVVQAQKKFDFLYKEFVELKEAAKKIENIKNNKYGVKKAFNIIKDLDKKFPHS